MDTFEKMGRLMTLGDHDNFPIFVADDDPDDCFLMKKAMQDGGLKNKAQFLKDGQELMDQLKTILGSTDTKEPTDMPCLILLDLNMPRLDGRETLKLLKSDDRLRKIPVMILTNSQNPEDIAGAYDDGASSFFTKPSDYKGLVSLMGLLRNYWLETVLLPVRSNS